MKGTLFDVVDETDVEKLDVVADQESTPIITSLDEKKANICRVPQSYDAIFINYFYEMKLPVVQNEDGENIFLFPNALEQIEESSEKKVMMSSCQVVLSTALHHSVEWLINILNTKLPERKGNILCEKLRSFNIFKAEAN